MSKFVTTVAKMVTPTNCCRYMYMYFGGMLAVMLFKPEIMYSMWGVEAAVFGTPAMSMFWKYMMAAIFGMICLFACAAQMGTSGQRLLLLITRLSSAAMVLTIILCGDGAIEGGAQKRQVVVQVVNSSLVLYVCLGLFKGDSIKARIRSDNKRMKGVLFGAAFLQLLWGGGWLLNPVGTATMMAGWPSVPTDTEAFFGRIFGCIILAFSFSGFFLSQYGSEGDQKKYLQYQCASMVAFITAFILGGADMLIDNAGVEMAQVRQLQNTLFVFAHLWALYPASLETWYLRYRAIHYGSLFYMGQLNWQLVHKISGCTNFSEEIIYLAANILFGLSFMMAIASTLDTAAQKKILGYTLIGWAVFLRHAWDEFSAGMFFWKDVILVVYKLYLINPHWFSVLKVGELANVVSGSTTTTTTRSPSPRRMRKRSATPMKKK